MIHNDTNERVLPVSDRVMVVRRDSAVAYTLPDYSRRSIPLVRGQYCTTEDEAYVYHDGIIKTIDGTTIEETNVGPIIDLFKIGSSFYFVKNKLNRNMLVRSDGNEIIEFSRLYAPSNGYLYSVEAETTTEQEDARPVRCNNRIVRINMETGERVEVATLEAAVAHISARRDDNTDVVCIADHHNNVHIFNGSKHISYHWSRNKILWIALADDSLIAVCKDKMVAKFGVVRDEKACLFDYLGEFVDSAVFDNRLCFLSDLQLVVYDLGDDAVRLRELLPGCAAYTEVLLQEEKEDENDVFKIKRETRVEIKNSLESQLVVPEKAELPSAVVGFSVGNTVLLLGVNGFIAQFILPYPQNFVTRQKVISVERRKSRLILHVYSIFRDRLVYDYRSEVSAKEIGSVYIGSAGLYYRASNALCRIGKLCNSIPVHSDDVTRIVWAGSLYVLDERGIYDADKESYVIKQKQVTGFCMCKGQALFYVSERGLFVETAGQRVLLDILDGFVAMKGLADSGGAGRFVVLIASSTGKRLVRYSFDGKAITLEKEAEVDRACNDVITEWACETATRQLLVQQTDRIE